MKCYVLFFVSTEKEKSCHWAKQRFKENQTEILIQDPDELSQSCTECKKVVHSVQGKSKSELPLMILRPTFFVESVVACITVWCV